MMEYLQWIIFIVLSIAVDNKIRSQKSRQYVGLLLLAGGLICAIWFSSWVHEVRLPSLPIGAILLGLGLYLDRHRYCRIRSSHPLLVVPKLNLAADFPDDPLMLHFLQLLHEDVGLPRHQAINLSTSINHDLGCSRFEARKLMTALKQDFGLKLGDYRSNRYFKRRGFDAYWRHVDRGSEGKIPLTIDMLYQAIKAKRWDTQLLESRGREES
jgi:hypothetical protein